MKAIITGGGTGGHIYPALAIARALEERGWKILYLGSKGGLESTLVREEGFNYQEVQVAPLPRKLSVKLMSSVFKTMLGFFQARKLIKEFQPDVVLGTGGFVAGPVVLAASALKIPSIIHEQNVYPGFTNKLLARKVDIIALNFAAARDYFPEKIKARFVVTGNPVRQAILNTDKEIGLEKLSLERGKKTILVFGGSQGAMSINRAMLEVYKYYTESNKVQIIQITGEKNYQQVLQDIEDAGVKLKENRHYKIIPYLREMEYAYAVADLVVYRAGATGIAEITAKGIPAILIPYPYAAENHQEYNARNLEKQGAAEVILDRDLKGQVLIEKIEELLSNEDRLKEMAQNSKSLGKAEATENIVSLIQDLLKKE
ncbi:MAG TPA: undecaprenyldiphospho-muramoylpentapeptide beta-N-acetylglucosaminyltransferase [Halanaerobiales bacterium]|nr:undecaprenyldiphospho-muramoylpentapeptide beta-N-acetylglucosaminyltransferase [Halanaerobiales bacterium]HPZ62232.1 undecaprenyldiphospho-muramoylpentapeptide beta-N-acetylglucosaminyltransferase [Halanaerobiales bacterium]HQD03612.1 undecaprenyldiphospho-muramoylpentapeptide beta-N-acetylglucosaminyltransferase [Halanaerobiales bacterium]